MGTSALRGPVPGGYGAAGRCAAAAAAGGDSSPANHQRVRRWRPIAA